MLLSPDDQVGDWTIDEFIDRGGNGEVYRARHTDGRTGALKVLRDARPDQVPYKRFAREVEVLSELGERVGILPLLDAHVPENPKRREKVWYVMPEARPLRQALEGRPVEDVVAAVRDIARALAALQAERDLAHRDVKPQNLYWWHDAPAVGDFGLVELPDKTSLTEPGRIPGAFGYIADELMQDPTADGKPADVYSLGKALWVLLTPGADFPPQGALSADGGPSSLERTLAVERAGELDRILVAATRHVATRISMAELASELDTWLTAPRREAPPDELAAAIGAAREAMQGTLAERDASTLRTQQTEEAAERLVSAAADLVALLRQVDPGAEVGPYAVGGLNKLIEHEEYMGGPQIETTLHYGVRVARGDGGLDRILLVCFCLQTATDGMAYLQGLVMEGYEETTGGTFKHFPRRSAAVGSIALDREIDAAVQEARDALPAVVQAFAEGAG